MIQLETVTLPDDLFWVDELSWTPVAASKEYSITGAMMVDASVMQSGRPVTLKSEDEQHSWITRAALLALQALAAIPGKEMTLSIYGVDSPVIFAPGEKPIEADPVWHQMPMDDADRYTLTAIRLIII